MILKILPLALLHSALLAMVQVLLKFALQKILPFSFSKDFWSSVLLNWQLLLCGVCFVSNSLLWIYIIKRFPFSVAYPLISLSYVFGLIAAIVFFHEHVELRKWIGVFLIMTGCVLIAR